jgi:tRNA A-37 threonylcarbamoyl transferase component Bud32/dienelactone hydrolase
MKCPTCQAEIVDDSRFCSKCGTPIQLSEDYQILHTRTVLRPIQELAPGTLLADKYRVVDMVGKGGMGIVYKAEDIKLKRNVALKFLPPELVKDKEARERLVIEAQAAAALSHPHICTIFEIAEEEDKPFIAMEYVEGQSLKAKMEKAPLELDEVLDIASQVAEGIEEAHKKGIIHRDIKSANIMVTDKGQAKIMDFGLAKVKGGTLLTREGTTLGTVAYMSPEQARGQEVDHRSDIWSLGVVLYEMLSGTLPFMGNREASILYSVVHEEPKPLKQIKTDLPPALQRIIDRALKKKPELRYSSAGEMLNDLKKYQDSLKAEEAGVFDLKSLLRRIRKPIIAVPGIVIVIILCLAAALFFKHQAKIRWAREEAIPEISRLMEIGFGNFIRAYELAEEAEKYIPDDPKLTGLLSRCAVQTSIQTSPPGAKIYLKEYEAPEKDWTFIGVTPVENIRLAAGFFRFRVEKEGYETITALSSAFEFSTERGLTPVDIRFTLDKEETIPPKMFRVPGGEDLDDFYMDKYEVTNRQFKEFLDDGGYQKREYWKHGFIQDGSELSWEEAKSEFVDQTDRPGPSTWQAGSYPAGEDNHPVSGISWYEAAAYAEYAGKSLPTISHWDQARGITSLYMNTYLIISLSNFGSDGPAPVGSYQGLCSHGAYDMAGNVREWCWNETRMGRCIRGGAWDDNVYMFGNISQLSPFDRSAKNGFRCVRYLEEDKIPADVFGLHEFERNFRDYSQEKPVPDAIFQVYKDQFSYDPKDLNIKVEARDESSEAWIKERVSFDTAYGDERMLANIFLPRNASPPYQAVIFFPGSSALYVSSSEKLEERPGFQYYLSYIVRNGRAVVYPVYKGTFERMIAPQEREGGESHQYAEWRIQLTKDFSRVIDYLETRPDFSSDKLAYYGLSWGGAMGLIIPAVEDRLRVNVLIVGGLPSSKRRPEVDEINFISRIKIPTLMLNGKYDTSFPFDTLVKPTYDLLGTPKENKRSVLYDSDHFIPKNELIKETLEWLDRYLGPVKK